MDRKKDSSPNYFLEEESNEKLWVTGCDPREEEGFK